MADKKDSELTINSTIVDVDLITLLDSETAVDEEKNKTVAASTIKEYIGLTLLTTVVEIGDWDMDNNAAKDVAHGLDMTKIRSITGMIRNDPATSNLPIGIISSDGLAMHVYVDSINSTNITLERLPTPSIFDTANYSNTPYNRGWIVIQHIE